ncbi:hypothetical protein JOQ06_006735 [Pogonophryne albipinna]|uniref:Zinc finger BED domain-containing protein 4 n=1 Tax=Pogonophryne albipinna TaxID=1090488 RepID=A0AAD6FHC7_9TELE|nr:hypothetical protein JOQ06_006735 [Pogonophryne albipinna]
MLNSWGIDKPRVHVILQDNARNMVKDMDDMEVTSVGCVAHTLQLAVHEGLLSQRSVIDALATARFFTKSDNLRLATDNLILEVAKIERAASEEPEAAEPMRKTPRQEASSSLGSVLDEIWEENQLEARSVSTSADVQVQTYLSEQPALGKAILYTTGKIMLHGSPHWMLLQPGFSVPPAPLWTVRDSLVQCPASLMRKGTGSHLTG